MDETALLRSPRISASGTVIAALGVTLVVAGCLASALQVVFGQPLFVFAAESPHLYSWMFFVSYGGVLAGLALLATTSARPQFARVAMIISVVVCTICALIAGLFIASALDLQGDTPARVWFIVSMFPIAVGPALLSSIASGLLARNHAVSRRGRLLCVAVPAVAIVGANIALVLLWRAVGPF